MAAKTEHAPERSSDPYRSNRKQPVQATSDILCRRLLKTTPGLGIGVRMNGPTRTGAVLTFGEGLGVLRTTSVGSDFQCQFQKLPAQRRLPKVVLCRASASGRLQAQRLVKKS